MTSFVSTKKPKSICLYFQVHQPARLNKLRFFDIGAGRNYFDEDENRAIIQRIAHTCYIPSNELLERLIHYYPNVRLTFSISGTALDQLEQHAPEALDSFRRLAATGRVEFLAETYYHSLSSLMPGNEFELQVAKHQKTVLRHFGLLPQVFRNTELIYSDETGMRIQKMGFKGVLIDGVDRALGGRTPHQPYAHPKCETPKLLARDYKLSDEIAFRFLSSKHTRSADRYMELLDATNDGQLINLGMDYETFGEHHKKESGIFTFLEDLLTRLAVDRRYRFVTPSDAVAEITTAEPLAIPGFISWADRERDVTAWLGNEMQRDAFDSLVRLEGKVKMLFDKQLLAIWRRLQTSDHFYYMSTKRGDDGQIHSYFSPYPSPYEAFINFMNVLTDLELKLKAEKSATRMPAPGDEIVVLSNAQEVVV